MKSKKQREEKIPAVTWIPLQPETSARTSLKSVADYLSEIQDDLPMPKRRLCLSPETLNLLENAEKLAEDAEKQISQMAYDATVNDDIGVDIFDAKRMEDDRIYVRNVVASTFEKGYYDPGPSTILNKENLKSKFTLTKPAKPSIRTYKSTKILAEPAKPIDDCLLCKSRKTEVIQIIPEKDKSTKFADNEKNVAQPRIEQERPEKLHVQKGPTISIKGDFSVQTSKIIDIQPDFSSTRQANNDHPENIATYEYCYGTREKSTSPDDIPEKDTPAAGNEEASRPILIQDESRSQINKSATSINPIADSHPGLSKDQTLEVEKKVQLWKELEDVDLELEDLSLSEPVILMEVESLLDQQRRIIRQVHEATERFDKFLVKRLPEDTSASDERIEENRCHKERRMIEKNNVKDERRDRRLLGEIRWTEASRGIGNIGGKSLGNFRHRSPSVSSDKPVAEDVSQKSNGNISIKSTSSGKSRTATEDSKRDSVLSRNKPIAETPKEEDYSDSFEYASSVEESLRESEDSNPKQPEAMVQEKNIEKEVSSNNSSIAQASAHTETKSNSGFIENLKSTHILKENNLDVNVNRKHRKTVGDILKSVENIVIDEDEASKKQIVYEAEKDTAKIKTTEEKENNGEKKNAVIEIQKVKNNSSKNHSAKEAVQHQSEEKEKDVSVEKPDEIENRKDGSTEKLQDHQETSQKTSHLIESISDISYHNAIGSYKDSQDSLRLSMISSDKSKSVSKKSEVTANESSAERSTESKIESKLSEARDNLNSLMKTMSEHSDKSVEESKIQNSSEAHKSVNGDHIDPEVPAMLENGSVHKDVFNNDKDKLEVVMFDSTILINQEHNFPNTRSFVTMLEENGSAVFESFQQQKLSLLKKLESCSIPSNYQSKRLFTSTVLGDTEPPNSFARLKTSSESSLETHSEGEVCMSSSASYSLGEVRKKIDSNKSSSTTKGSSSNSTNNASLPRSIGEVCSK